MFSTSLIILSNVPLPSLKVGNIHGYALFEVGPVVVPYYLEHYQKTYSKPYAYVAGGLILGDAEPFFAEGSSEEAMQALKTYLREALKVASSIQLLHQASETQPITVIGERSPATLTVNDIAWPGGQLYAIVPDRN